MVLITNMNVIVIFFPLFDITPKFPLYRITFPGEAVYENEEVEGYCKNSGREAH